MQFFLYSKFDLHSIRLGGTVMTLILTINIQHVGNSVSHQSGTAIVFLGGGLYFLRGFVYSVRLLLENSYQLTPLINTDINIMF